MNTLTFNDRRMLPVKIFLHEGKWLMQGSLDNKKVLIDLNEVVLFENTSPVDEVVIIRPLTNKIIVDEKTNDVLKIFVDSNDKITSVAHENRFTRKSTFELPPIEVVNDAIGGRKSKRKR